MATIGTIITNERITTFYGGEKVYTPKVALATSWATMRFEDIGNGVVATITCNGITINLVANSNGKATMSLYPFIMDAVKNALDNPMPTDGEETTMLNPFRNFLVLNVVIGGNAQRAEEIIVPFIYGGANPYAPVFQEYRDYIPDTSLGTWATFDLAEWYDNTGEIIAQYTDEWQEANFNLVEWLSPTPTDNYTKTIGVALFYGDKITFANLNLSLRYDCRTENVMRIKWLDARGGINSRLLTFAGESESGGTASTYERFHWDKVADTQNDGYWHGTDKWAQRKATKQITLGDDAISQNQFSWLSGLVQSACIEVYRDGIWQRANIVDSAIERDPRKATFSMTITLELAPDYEPQQF